MNRFEFSWLLWFPVNSMIPFLKPLSCEQKKEAAIFLIINAVFPFIMSIILLEVINSIRVQWVMAIVSILIILIANIYRIIKSDVVRKIYLIIIILNLLSFVFAGGISFVTNAWFWPVILRSLYEITLGDGYIGRTYFLGF